MIWELWWWVCSMDGGDNNSGLPCDVIDGTDVRVDDSLSAHCTVHSNPLPDPLRSKAAQHCAVQYCTAQYYTVYYCTVQTCTVQYYTVQFSALFSDPLLYCTALCTVSLCCSMSPYLCASSSISNVVLNNCSYLKWTLWRSLPQVCSHLVQNSYRTLNDMLGKQWKSITRTDVKTSSCRPCRCRCNGPKNWGRSKVGS